MKQFLAFLKTVAAGGLLIVLPLLLIYFMIVELLEAVVGLASPITALLPGDMLEALDQ